MQNRPPLRSTRPPVSRPNLSLSVRLHVGQSCQEKADGYLDIATATSQGSSPATGPATTTSENPFPLYQALLMSLVALGQEQQARMLRPFQHHMPNLFLHLWHLLLDWRVNIWCKSSLGIMCKKEGIVRRIFGFILPLAKREFKFIAVKERCIVQ
jgi:hypothetical protein